MNLRTPLSLAVITAAAVSLMRRYGPVRRFEIVEASMAPALQPGDYVITVRRGPLRRGSQVVYEHPGRQGFFLAKRVVGLPGEQVAIREGLVLIDDMPLIEPWAHSYEGPDGGWDVPSDCVFVLGDDRRRSRADSRHVGPIPLGQLDFVISRYWPLTRAGR